MNVKKLLFSFGIVACLSASISILSFADDLQDQFLADMAAGLNARWAITETLDASKELSAEEEMKTRYSYLGAELEYIEKYKDASFSNPKLDILAKTYIYGVELQKNSVQYYDTYNVIFGSQWDAGYTTRAVALCDIYDYYGLDIDSTHIDEMRSDAKPQYTYEITSSNTNSSGETTEDKLEIVSVEAAKQAGYIELSYKVKNLADTTLSDLSLSISNLDENGDIIGFTYLSSPSSVEAGQSITLTGSISNEGNPVSLKVESYSYSDETSLYQEDTFVGSPTFINCNIEEILSNKYAREVQSASATDVLLFNKEGISVYLAKAERLDDFRSFRLHMRVENLNHHDILVTAHNFTTVINGNMVSSTPWAEVNSGKTSTVNWDLDDYTLADAGIEKLETISFKIAIEDADSYSTMYIGEEIFLNVDENYNITTRVVYTDSEHIRQVQELLNKLGYECGSADGVPGKKTNSCILAFEQDNGLTETTDITPELIAALEEAAQ